MAFWPHFFNLVVLTKKNGEKFTSLVFAVLNFIPFWKSGKIRSNKNEGICLYTHSEFYSQGFYPGVLEIRLDYTRRGLMW